MAAPQVLNQATNQTARRWILSIGGASIVATGAILGAGLREERDYVQKRKKVLEAGPEAMIAHLEAARTDLVRKRTALEKQILDHRESQKESEKKGEMSAHKPRTQLPK